MSLLRLLLGLIFGGGAFLVIAVLCCIIGANLGGSLALLVWSLGFCLALIVGGWIGSSIVTPRSSEWEE